MQRLLRVLRALTMSVDEHREKAKALESAAVAVITVSDTRVLDTDTSGLQIVHLLEAAGHRVLERTVVPDDPEKVRLVLGHWLGADAVDVVILNGGTGIAPRDGTVEVVRALLDRELPGFGELFRYLSFQEIGAAAMLSRAVGGIASGKVVFALPGSRKGVALGMRKLIVPELLHLVAQVRGI